MVKAKDAIEPACRYAFRATVIVLASCLVVETGGCAEGGDCASALFVRGWLVDAGTGPIDAAVAGQAFTDGERTDYKQGRLATSDEPPAWAKDEGSFQIVFNTGSQYPCPPLGPRPFPRPDQVEIIVVRNARVHRFLIDINEDTVLDVVDTDFPGYDVIELIDPILIPPCEE